MTKCMQGQQEARMQLSGHYLRTKFQSEGNWNSTKSDSVLFEWELGWNAIALTTRAREKL